MLVETVISLAILFLSFLAFLLVAALLQEVVKQKQPNIKRYELRSQFLTVKKDKLRQFKRMPLRRIKKELKFDQSANTLNQSVDSQTQKCLFSLVNGEKETAHRLVAKLRENNPLRSEQWLWEKAIYDLERDRRS